MIEINLVPQNLRKKKRKSLSGEGLNIPREAIIGLCGGLVVLLVIIHVLLQLLIFSKYGEHNKLAAEWKEILPQKENVDIVMNKLRALQGKIKSAEEVVGERKILWSQKLNEISNQLAPGVWLSTVAFDGEILFIKGSAVSRGGEEMISVHRFASNLKEKGSFLDDLKDFELGSLQRRSIKDIEIADFSIKVKSEKVKAE